VDGCEVRTFGGDGRKRQARPAFIRQRFEAERGPIPAGHHLHHVCEEPRCSNLDHLVPVTAAEHKRLHGWGWSAHEEFVAFACPACGDLVDGPRCEGCGARTL
jgi:hypothetical protein